MSFHKNPIIDTASRTSERSERHLKGILNQDSGFICREEVPDKGCDFEVELILDKTGASNWKFAIQLKSVEKMALIEDNTSISYSFSTSRLGYLLRRVPAYGVIVLYSVEEDKCFYEFVDKIYQRLMEERETDSWKDQDKVNIHIPYHNLLNAKAAEKIHEIIRNRYENATIMQQSQGHKYGLPVINVSGEFKYDFNNVEHLQKFLSEHGALMLNNYDVGSVYSIIRKVPNAEIYKSKELSILAAYSYGEVGLHADSELYSKKLLKFDLDAEEKTSLRYLQLKNKRALGYIDDKGFLSALCELKKECSIEQNTITLAINIARYQLAEKKTGGQWAPAIEKDILEVFDQLNESKLTDRLKGLLTLWNCDNLSFYSTGIETSFHSGRVIRYDLGLPNPNEETHTTGLILRRLQGIFDKYLLDVKELARRSGDDLLKAHSLALEVRNYIHHQITYYSFHFPVNTLPGFEKQIKNIIGNALLAYQLFIDQAVIKEAHDSLCNAIELIELAENGYGFSLRMDKNELYQKKGLLENDLDIETRESIFLSLIATAKENQDDNKRALKNYTDVQIDMLAELYMKKLRVPEERLINIINEIKGYRLFYQRCSDPKITIFKLDPDNEPQNMYLQPARFVLHCRARLFNSLPNIDIETLLKSWDI